jgi:hypothetical protein
MRSAALQQKRPDIPPPAARVPASRRGGSATHPPTPSSRPISPREGPPPTCGGARFAISGGSRSITRMSRMEANRGSLKAGCGKVPNRISPPFRSVRHFHPISCGAGTGPFQRPLQGSFERGIDRHRSLTEETKKREFERHARVSADKLAPAGVCLGLIDFVHYASEFSYKNEKQ